MYIEPVFQRADINPISARLQREEEPIIKALSVIDSLDRGNRFNIGLDHEIAAKQLELVHGILEREESDRDLHSLRDLFLTEIGQIREDYIHNFKGLIGAKDQVFSNEGYLIPTDSEEAKQRVLEDYTNKLDQRLDYYRNSFSIQEDTDLRATAEKLTRYVTGRREEFETIQDQQTELSMTYLDMQQRLAPIISAIKKEINEARSNEPMNLYHACYLGQLEAVDRFIKEGRAWYSFVKSRVNEPEKGGHGFRALDYAAYQGDVRIVNYLLYHKADPNLPDRRGYTPLHWAAQGGYERNARALLRANADVNARGEYERTPLHMASFQGRIRLARLLLSQGGVESNAQTSPEGRSVTALHNAVTTRNRELTISLLSDNRINPHIPSAPFQGQRRGVTPFEMAVCEDFREDEGVVRAFLENPNFYRSNLNLQEVSERAGEIARLHILNYIAHQ